MASRCNPRTVKILFPRVYNSVTLPSLTELTTRTDQGAFALFPYIQAPRLELLIVEDYDSFTSFTTPYPTSCPALRRVRFNGHAKLVAIQQFLLTVPKEQIERVNIEIEYSKFAEDEESRRSGTEVVAERRKWIDEEFGVRWIVTQS
ncbi:hypothetical protein FRC01_011693 [Tulasnella sp. 417]|nr:hypothetical protein FRC01_011693 [Tulasnella sp. 417]